MKVLEISVRSDIGGGPKHLMGLIEKLDQKGIEIYSAIPKKGDYADKITSFSKAVFHIPFRRFSFSIFINILVFCKKYKIEIIHSHGRGAGIYSRLLSVFGLKVVHTFHGVHIERGLIGRVKLFIDQILLPLTDKFICVSASERINALKFKIAKDSKIVVINNGVKLLESPTSLRPRDIFTIGTLSRLNHQKGLDILLEYLERFEREEKVSFRCEIAGEGELKEDLLEQKQTDSIKLVGNVNPNKFLGKIDLYISFARWEGLPIAVLEAMGQGVPCLLSNVDGNKDLIRNEENGLLFDLDNYQDFKIKLLQSIKNPSASMEMAKNARVDIETEYSIPVMAKKILAVYLALDKK